MTARLLASAAASICVVTCAVSVQAEDSSKSLPVSLQAEGGTIFAKHCAACHGERGEGAPGKHEEPLYGDRSLAELTKIIHETMPEDKAELCEGDDAKSVALWIYETFYTTAARAKNSPARIALSHLTAGQHENALADIFAEFAGQSGSTGEERGLKAEYFNWEGLSRGNKVFERIDPQVDFDFGEKAPAGGQFKNTDFAVYYHGSLIVDHIGDYQFRARSENGFRLWVNQQDNKDALIDAWVSATEEPVEHTASIRLLGGRRYAIRLEMFTYKEKTASIQLQWKPPGGAWSVIPLRHLSPHGCPPVFVADADFPADDSSYGYPRGIDFSKSWDEATTRAALAAAEAVETYLPHLCGVKKNEDLTEDQVRRFCGKFVSTAFSRPLTEEEKNLYIERQFQEGGKFSEVAKRVVLIALKSPYFLYAEVPDGKVDDHDIARRLSLALWDSLPDRELREAADRGGLQQQSQVEAHARRLLQDPRARAKVRGFFSMWLPLERGMSIKKDADAYPGFTPEHLADARTSLDLFLDEVFWSERSDYRELLLADYQYLNPRLAEFYGVELPEGEGFRRVNLQSQGRAGLVTHPYLMASLAYHDNTSPIHRGVFVTRKLLARALSPPPEAIEFSDTGLPEDLTMREKVEAQTNAKACQTCHSIINPLGFSLEHFDAVGRYRSEDAGKAIDAASEYLTRSGQRVRFTSARNLAEFVAQSPDAQAGIVEHLFQHVVKQPPGAYGEDTIKGLRESFARHDFNMRELLGEIAVLSARHGVKPID